MDMKRLLSQYQWTRRDFLSRVLGGGLLSIYLPSLILGCAGRRWSEATFISKVDRYDRDIATTLLTGLRELNVGEADIRGKRVLLKPNFVETIPGRAHINTHPSVIQAAMETFLRLGARGVVVAEGPGHCRDSLRLLDESGLGDVLRERRVSFVDLNMDDVYGVPNAGRKSRLKALSFPVSMKEADYIVSMPKLKTHHLAGVTLSMKNLFGVMPGIVYGWPKNVLHYAGIDGCILDIYATLRPDLAIVDGVVGMEGDGPLMGEARPAGVIVIGRNFPAVDATCARIMGFEPTRVSYLAAAANWLGPIDEQSISQRGEALRAVATRFSVDKNIPALKKLISG